MDWPAFFAGFLIGVGVGCFVISVVFIMWGS